MFRQDSLAALNQAFAYHARLALQHCFLFQLVQVFGAYQDFFVWH